ncbi:MAG: NFACT family protein [Cyanobacteria bacterium RUI128]|nr:NFACT family protein [Cyanobacteria bacterium RUI128]
MITLDYLTLKAFYEENKDFFMGARLQKIQQPTRRDFVLSIRGFETRKLYINIDPQVYHICFINDNTYERRNITIPQKPPMFCMLLRKYLEGFRITGVKVPPYERIFEIYFESYNELNEKIKLCLAIELMGKYSNVILYNCDTKLIIGCAHNVGSEKSRDRELAGTLPYVYPQKQDKSDILRYFGEVQYDSLNVDFMGFSKAFQEQLKRNSVGLDKIKDYVDLKSPLSPAANSREYSIYSELLQTADIYPFVNEMIDEYFSKQQEVIIKRALRIKLKNLIYPQYKKEKLLAEKLEGQLKKKSNAAKYKKYADLILANLYNNDNYSSSLKVVDWEDAGNEITIKLDKRLTLQENSKRYYELYSKSKSAVERLTELKNNAEVQAEYLKGILYSTEQADRLSDLFEILSECEDIGLIKKREQQKKNKEINVMTVEINGYKVYVGKNNKQNDFIVSKTSSPDDYWFHVQNTHGSHVLLKIEDSREPDDKTILECCRLAKRYSSASNDTKAGVIYTKRKFLKKPPKANLGYVTYKNEKEIIV